MSGEKIGFCDRIKNKLRYSSFLRIVLDGIAKTGIRINLYYIVLEGLFNRSLPYLESSIDGYELCFLSPQDMKTISFIPGRHFTEESLLQRLQKGQKCFGLKYRGELAAFTWCDFDWCSHVYFKGKTTGHTFTWCNFELCTHGYKFPLKDNEA